MIVFYSGTGIGRKDKYTAPEEFLSNKRVGFMLTFNDFNKTRSDMSIGRFKRHRRKMRSIK